MALWMVAGRVVAEGRKRSRARFTAAVVFATNSSKSKLATGGFYFVFVLKDMPRFFKQWTYKVQGRFTNFDIAFGMQTISVSRSTQSHGKSFERRTNKKSTGESWQPQRSGQSNFAPSAAAQFGLRGPQPSPGCGYRELGRRGHRFIGDHR